MVGGSHHLTDHILNAIEGGAVTHAGWKLAVMVFAFPTGAFNKVTDFKVEFEFTIIDEFNLRQWYAVLCIYFWRHLYHISLDNSSLVHHIAVE
jgi:hypothetical protein